jgi:cathepsin L
MKAILALAAVVLAVSATLTEQEYQNRFQSWMQSNKKSYNHDQFQFRYRIFKQNTDFIESHNAAGKPFKVAMNKFGDITNKEYRRLFLGFNSSFVFDHTKVHRESNISAPASFDWRKQGAVTPIKDQAQCGSCWAFSTTGSVEGCHKLAGKSLTSLSEQNIMDCSDSYGNEGCNGGLMTQAMQYIIDNKGVDTEASYPYTAEDGTCTFNSANVGATLGSYVNVNSGDEADLIAKATKGPVSVAIDASQASFQFYSSGVYNEPACSSDQLDHGVLAVGWGTDSTSGSDYYIVKNSWGTSWGMQGYIWMSRNKENQCGIATMATLPQGC